MSKLKEEISKEKILKALSNIKDGRGGPDVVSAGLVSSIVIKGNSVGFAIEVDIDKAKEKEDLRQRCEAAVRSISGVVNVTAVLTSSNPAMQNEKEEQKPQAITVPVDRTIPGVKNIIVVASGKGGVGKSTVAVNLARSLVRAGNSVGIADIDIYGPSVPKMLGLTGKPEVDDTRRMLPKESNGLKSISIGYLVDEGNSVVWRSSMALKAMNQLLRGVSWGKLDYLVIDTPPGTGDIQLSLSKGYAITGVVLVSTPQDVALIDVKKAADMFGKVKVPVLGIIENMSYFEDDHGKKNYIFGTGGVKQYAEQAGIKFLGEIPLKSEIREASDSGKELDESVFMQKITFNLKRELEKAHAV